MSESVEVEQGEEMEAAEGVATEAVEDAAQPNEERRRAYRLNKVLGATMTSTDGDSKTTRLFVIDISNTGFRATDHQPPGEEECDISIVLEKGQEPFASRMRVVWVKELTVSGMFQMGCEFVDTSVDDQVRLDAFIEQEQAKSSQATGSSTIKIDNPWTML